MSIFPYAYRMIESFDIANNENQTSMYAGMLITAFAFAEFSTGMLWGRISDRVGRKPVLIMGLVGTALSMISFGFARSLPMAIISRALGGLLNGNVGVLQTTVAELVTKKEHQPRAYSIMPFVWCLGSIIGPAMGGALAMPCEAYPWLFPKGTLFDAYPFLLPNLVSVVILVFGITTGFLFLEETHAEKKHHRDVGLECGDLVLEKLFKIHNIRNYERCEVASLTENPSTPDVSVATEDDLETGFSEKTTKVSVFNRQVILIIVGYGILAYHSVSFDSLMPVFLSEAKMETKPVLPFKFSGGFALSTKSIGFMMAVQGVYSMIAQLWLFPFIVRRIGTLGAFRLVMMAWPFLYFAVPYLVLLPENLQSTGIYIALLTKMTFHTISFPSNAILLANAAPSKSVLGTINGVAASTACLARAFGPTVTGAVHAAGLKFGCNGLAWWAAGLICAVGALESFFMEETDGRPSEEPEEEEPLCEPLLHSTNADDEEPGARRGSLVSLSGLDLDKFSDSKTLVEVTTPEEPKPVVS